MMAKLLAALKPDAPPRSKLIATLDSLKDLELLPQLMAAFVHPGTVRA